MKLVACSKKAIMMQALTLLAVFAGFSTNAYADQRLVLNFKGTGTPVPRQVPDQTGLELSNNGWLAANCFSADVFDLKTGRKMGTAEDCLSEIAVGGATDSGTGVQVVGTTIFNLAQGRLVIQGLTSVQEVNWPTSNAEGIEFTHITGANSPYDAVLHADGDLANTGRFKSVEATVRLSGQVNLEKVGDVEPEITFDCIFVVDISRKRK